MLFRSGTGPYRFVKFVRDDRVELGRNPLYWGVRPPYQTVTPRFIPNDAARATVAQAIIKQATPHAVNAEVGPGRPLGQDTALQRKDIVKKVGQDFERGMQVALGLGIVLSIFSWFLTFFGLPRGHGSIPQAEQEAAKVEADEAG